MVELGQTYPPCGELDSWQALEVGEFGSAPLLGGIDQIYPGISLAYIRLRHFVATSHLAKTLP